TKVFVIYALAFRRLKKGMPDGFNSPPIARQAVFVLLKPKRDGCRYLRCCGGGAFAILTHFRTLFEYRPGNIRSVGCDRRCHTAIRSPTALELSASNFVIRLAVRHHTGDRNCTMISCRINYVVRGQSADVI